MILGAIFLSRRRDLTTLFFLLAVGSLLLPGTLTLAVLFGALPAFPLIEYGNHIGAIAMSCLFSLLVADAIRQQREPRCTFSRSWATAPYGHDGRSINLTEVILRHGGEAQEARDAFAALDPESRGAVLRFLESLILFPPDDTASNLDPGDRGAPGFPQFRHGSIRLTALFNNPSIVE